MIGEDYRYDIYNGNILYFDLTNNNNTINEEPTVIEIHYYLTASFLIILQI